MYFLLYPLIGIFFANLLFFIIASFFDLQIMNFFANGLKNSFLRYLSAFYIEIGYTELYIAFILAIFIIVEYLWIYLKKKKGLNRTILSWAGFALAVAIWFFLMWSKIHNKWNFDYHYDDEISHSTVQYNLNKMLTAVEYRWILVVVVSYQFIVLMSVLLYTELVFVRKENFEQRQYWITGIKVLVYFFIVYFLVGTLKVLMGRNFFNGLRESIQTRIKWAESVSGIKIIFQEWMVSSIEGYQPWWEFTGLIGDPGSINWSLDKLFVTNSFPSGHMAQLGMVGFCFIFIIDPKNPKSLNTWKISAIYLFFIHQLLMVISFLIGGSHWLTDTTFSWMWTICSIYFANALIDKILKKEYINVSSEDNSIIGQTTVEKIKTK